LVGIGASAFQESAANNWQNIDAALDRAPEPLSTLGAGQGVVCFYGLAKPVRTPLIGPAQQP
jgi:hypothetical protein